jgi:hypothetical protein
MEVKKGSSQGYKSNYVPRTCPLNGPTQFMMYHNDSDGINLNFMIDRKVFLANIQGNLAIFFIFIPYFWQTRVLVLVGRVVIFLQCSVSISDFFCFWYRWLSHGSQRARAESGLQDHWITDRPYQSWGRTTVGLTEKGKCLGRSNKSGTQRGAGVGGAKHLDVVGGLVWLRIEEAILRATSKLVFPRKWKSDQAWSVTNKKYKGADKSLARSTSRCILFDGENILFHASLVIYIYINSTNVPPIMIINRIYEHQNLLSL